MALIKCPECGKEVSDQAQQCIHCGYPLNPPTPDNQVKCPKCGSTTVSTNLRGWTVKSGLLGSAQPINRCGNCGYQWYPKGN